MYNHGFRSVYRLNAHIVLVVKYQASGGGVTVEQLRNYAENQEQPKQ
jgi:REP element-mobilizing transposase RayT